MHGIRNIPLDYVIDTTDRAAITARTPLVEEDDIDVYNMEFIGTLATHHGSQYAKDNKKVLLLLKKHLMNTPSYNHIISAIDRLDGHAAYTTLVAYYEGEDFRKRNISSAFKTLNSTFYHGDTPRFTFEKYVLIQMDAHCLLYEAEYNGGQGMDDATKIQHLKNGIKAKAGLEHALTTARTNRMAQGDFNAFVTFLSAEVDSKNKRKQQLKSCDRNVHSVSSSQSGGKRKTSKGRGGNRPALGPMLSAVVDGKKVEGKIYPQNEFSALSKKQHAKVIELYCKRKEAGKSNNTVASVASLSDTISAAVVAGVRAAAVSNIDKESLTIDVPTNDTQSASSNCSATAEGVGDFIAKRRKVHTPDNTST